MNTEPFVNLIESLTLLLTDERNKPFLMESINRSATETLNRKMRETLAKELTQLSEKELSKLCDLTHFEKEFNRHGRDTREIESFITLLRAKQPTPTGVSNLIDSTSPSSNGKTSTLGLKP